MKRRLLAWGICAVLGGLAPARSDVRTAADGQSLSAAPGDTLSAIRKRGRLRCGASAALAGFGQMDAQGRWSGFDVDFCRAIATAVFGEPGKVEFVPLTTKERFAALSAGTVDVLVRDTTWTLTREARHDILFAGVTFYDGQAFLVRKSLGVGNAVDLQSDSICVQQDTTTELNLADYFHQRNLRYQPKVFATAQEAEDAFRAGRCGAYTTDASALFSTLASLPDPAGSTILPQIIAKEPLGPAVRQGDDAWFLVVRWTLNAMIDAEEMGITQVNVDTLARGDNPRIRRLLGVEGSFGAELKLSPDWAYRVIKLVGNYNDVFQRNIGDGSRLKIKRGLNELWTHGGLLYAEPIQ